MDLRQQLKKLGLNKSEATVYLYVLENGIATPPQIGKGTGIARTNCYNILASLREKELIAMEQKGGRKAYLARDPESLLLSLERKKEVAEEVIPDLRLLYTTQKNKPKIQFFDGWEEVKQIYHQSLSAEKVVAIGSTEKLEKLESGFLEWYQRQLNRNKILFYDILTYISKEGTAKIIKEMRGPLHYIKFLPDRYKDTPTDMLIWKNTIALIALEEPIFGTLITSPPLHQTFQIIFDILWEKL